MKTRIMVSLHHNDHIIWSAFKDVDSELARLMSPEELARIGEGAVKVLAEVVSSPSADDRPLVEKKKKR